MFQLRRRFIYGTQYIDEQVAQITRHNELRFVLQDANYNIVGLARECDGALIRQYRYEPYGQFELDGAGLEIGQEDGAGATIAPLNSRLSWHGFQGLWLDAETGLLYARGRYLKSIDGRFLSPDPNGLGTILTTVLAMNAQTLRALASIGVQAQSVR
ncbi:MAG: hypothetical protein IH898_08770 [Planctomycetes bacterium]|nr:hypothetical protein [Planctomycetota bacterium]